MCNLKEGDLVLDQSYGEGVFYNNLPDYVNKEWCEIDKGKDFFEYDKKVETTAHALCKPRFSAFEMFCQRIDSILKQSISISSNNNAATADIGANTTSKTTTTTNNNTNNLLSSIM